MRVEDEKKRSREDESRALRTRKWWVSRARNGHASICPECGGYTLAPSGYHRVCARSAGIAAGKELS